MQIGGPMSGRRSALGGTLRNRILVEPLIAVLLWGGTFTAAKIGMNEIPPLSFTVERIAIGAGLLCLSWTRGPVAGVPWRLLVPAALAQTAFQSMFMQSIHLTTAGLSAILLATSPLLTAGWLAARGQQRLARVQWTGLIIGFAGVGVVMASDIGDVSGTLLGNVLALAAGAAWAWYGVAIARPARVIGPARAAGVSLLMAGVVLAPFALPQIVAFSWATVSGVAWAGLTYGGVLGLAVPTALWVRAVGRYGTQAAMNYGYVEPVAAVFIAALVLRELLTPLQLAGALLALVGVFLASEAHPLPVGEAPVGS